jgi:hypothetical protein
VENAAQVAQSPAERKVSLGLHSFSLFLGQAQYQREVAVNGAFKLATRGGDQGVYLAQDFEVDPVVEVLPIIAAGAWARAAFRLKDFAEPAHELFGTWTS